MGIDNCKQDVIDEVSVILSPDFTIGVIDSRTVPHSSDGAITFPNLDEKTQGTKLIETTVLYVDMRSSTQLSLQHKRETLAKLYSAFVRAMTRCANEFGGEVRGIIGDRVMVLFQQNRCFENAVNTAILMNSVCKYVLNKHFVRGEVQFGIGIDYGRMLATKTGVRRHGVAQQSYRSLVWLGHPANIASKLTDNANKPGESVPLTKVNVGYSTSFGGVRYQSEWPDDFIKKFTYNPYTHLMTAHNPLFHSYAYYTWNQVIREETPPILMTKSVFDGFRNADPNALSILNGWLKPINVHIPGYNDTVYGGDIIYVSFKS